MHVRAAGDRPRGGARVLARTAAAVLFALALVLLAPAQPIEPAVAAASPDTSAGEDGSDVVDHEHQRELELQAGSDAEDAGGSRPRADGRAPELRIGVTAIRGNEKCLEMWGPLAAYVSSAAGFERVRIVPLDLKDDLKVIRSGAIDFVITNPSNAVVLERVAGLSPTLTIRSRRPDRAALWFGSVIFSRVDRTDILSLEDLKGKRFAAVEPNSLGGWQAAAREMLEKGLDVDVDLQEVIFTGLPHDQAVRAVLDGEADAGCVRVSTLEAMADEGLIRMSSLRILNERLEPDFKYRLSSRLYPEWALGHLPTVDSEVARRVNAALLALEADHPAAESAEISGFVPALDYEPVHACLRQLGMFPYVRDRSTLLRDAVSANRNWITLIVVAALAVLLALVVMARASLRLRETRRRLWVELDERHAVEAQLRQLAIVASHTDNIVMICNRDGLITWVNEAFEHVTGYTFEEARGQAPTALLASPEAPPATTAYISDRVREGKGFNVETLNRRKGGEDYWISIDVRPVHDGATQNLTGFIGVGRDITEHHRIDAELRASREMLGTVLDNVPQMIFWKNRDARFLGCNRAFARSAGLERADEVIGKQDADIARLADRADSSREADEQVMRNGRPYWASLHYVRENGEVRWVDQIKMPLRNGAGRTIGVIGFEEDVTDRREAIQKLRESEHRYHELFDKMADAAFVADPGTGEILDANRRALELMGADLRDLVGLHHSRLHPESSREECQARFASHAGGEPDMRFEAIVQTFRGDEVPVEISAAPMVLNGQPMVVGLFRDIRDRKQAELEVAARLRYEEALANCARTLVSGDDDATVRTALRYISDAFGVRAIHLCKADAPGHLGSSPIWPSRCVCGESARECERMMNGECKAYGDALPRWREMLQRGEPVILTGPRAIESMPPEILDRGVQSCVLLPVIIGRTVRAFLSVEDVDAARTWSSEDLAVLWTTAEMVSAQIQRSEASRALRLKQRHLDLALEAAKQGTWEWSTKEGRFSLSSQAQDMMGCGTDDGTITYADLLNSFVAVDREDVQRELDSCRLGRRSRCRFEVRAHQPLGRVFWQSWAGEVAERDSLGVPVRVVGVVIDIDDRKRNEEEMRRYTDELVQVRDELESQTITLAARTAELEIARRDAIQASRAKSEFLANMSHEIRTPMTSVLGYTDLLLQGEDLEGHQRDHLQTIRRNGEHLLSVINDILDFSKIEADRMLVECIDVTPATILADVALLMGWRAEEVGVTLETAVDESARQTIHTDPTRLRQILINLISNAIKFSARGSSVRVVCERINEPIPRPPHRPGEPRAGRGAGDSATPLAGACMRFSVIDHGIGMTAEQMSRLFRPFEQGDPSTSRCYGGSGLGLAISGRLATLLGGSLRAQSVKDHGSVFTLDLPLDADAAAPTTDPQEAAAEVTPPAATAGSRGRVDRSDQVPTAPATPEAPQVVAGMRSGRVLLAEDGPDNRRLITFMLQKAGLSVDHAVNGREAVERALAERAAGTPYDLIFMDMQMPELDGYEATRQLREAGMTGPIVALTAHALTSDREICLQAGCTDYGTKPISSRDLLALASKYLPPVESDPASANADTGSSGSRPSASAPTGQAA